MQYNKPNLAGLQDYLNNNSGGGGDIKWWSLPIGTSIIRVLPPWDQTGRVALEVYQHRIEYTDPGSKYTKYNWTCVDRTFGRPCNICQGLKEMRDAGVNTEDWEANSRQFYINALIVQDPGYGRSPDALMPGTHVLMRIPKTVFDWIVTQITNPAIGDITDPQSGIDIMVTRSGSGLDTRYSCTLSPNGRQPIDPNILNSLELYNLSDVFSTGFDDQRIANLVMSLKTSAMHLTGAIPQIQQQMNVGYQPQIPTRPVTNPVPQTPPVVAPQYAVQQQMMPGAYQMPNQQNGLPNVPASPYQVGAQPVAPQVQVPQVQAPVPPVQVQQPVATAPQPVMNPVDPAYPSCFGHYNAADVTCITCPYEVDCTRNTK